MDLKASENIDQDQDQEEHSRQSIPVQEWNEDVRPLQYGENAYRVRQERFSKAATRLHSVE